MKINLRTVFIDYKNHKTEEAAIMSSLGKIAECDCDLTGENGSEYNWRITDEQGFPTNLDYLFHYISTYENTKDMIRNFFLKWFEYDDYYYDPQFDFATDENGKIVSISLAYGTDD